MKTPGFALACLVIISGCAGGGDTLQVTWLANEGVLLASGSDRVLIDAFVPEPYSIYTALPEEVADAMLAGRRPFEDIDVALVSHIHRDHVQPDFARRFFRAHAETAIASSPQVLASLEQANATPIYPDPGNSAHWQHGDISVELLNLSHGSGRFASIQNLGHIVTINGFKVLHIGDAAMNEENFAPYALAGHDIDVALIPYWYFGSADGRKIVDKHLNARLMIAVHLPRPGEDDRGIDAARGEPSVVVPARSMQSWTLSKEIDEQELDEAFDTGADNQLGLTFTPDGSTAFWVAWDGAWGGGNASRRVIYTSQRKNGAWGKPVPVQFSGDHSDTDPFVSPDGRWLYFVSDRATHADDESPDANIWRYSLIEDDRLEVTSVNSEATEYSPVVTASGALYFASDRDGGPGQGDLYRAAPLGDGFLAPEALGPAFNTSTGEWNLWVSEDESEIIFEASSRETNVSIPGDLYYSWRTPTGWTPAMPMTGVNSRDSELMPRLHPDGKTLYYTTAPIGGHARIATAEWARLRSQIRAAYRKEVKSSHGAALRGGAQAL